MADDVFEMQDEGHFHRKRKYANAKEVRAAMDKRLKSRRHHANSHPRSVKALRKSLRYSKHAKLSKTHEILPFSKIWKQHHRNHSLKLKQKQHLHLHLHGDPEPASLLAMRRAKVNKTSHEHGSKHRHRSFSLIAKRIKSKFTKIAEAAEKSVVHKKVADNEVVEFETGDFEQKEEQHEQAWLKALQKVEHKLKRRQLGFKMGMNQTNRTNDHTHKNHTLGKNHTNHTKSYI